MASRQSTLDIWNRLRGLPGGRWLFGKLLCLKAPYFASISPRFRVLEPNYCEVAVRKRRKVLNHIGTVHAIAMCNMAELAGGTMTEVSVPLTHRWIPRGMDVQYLRKADTSVVAFARPMDASHDFTGAGEFKVDVVIRDTAGEAVFKAIISMWVSPKKA